MIVLVHCPRSQFPLYLSSAGTPDAGDALEEDAFAVVRYQFRPQQRELSGAEIVANLMISLSYFLCLLEEKKRDRQMVFVIICALNGIFLLPMVEGVNTVMNKAHFRAESESFEEIVREQRSAEATERALKMHRRSLLWAESDEEAKEVEVEEIVDEVHLPSESSEGTGTSSRDGSQIKAQITRHIRRNSSGADDAEEQSSATAYSSIAEAATSFFSGLFRASDGTRAAKIEEAEDLTIFEVVKAKAGSVDAKVEAGSAKVEEDERAKARIAEVTTAEAADAKARALIAESKAAEYRRLLVEKNKDGASLAAAQVDEGEARGGRRVDGGGDAGFVSRRNADEDMRLAGGVVSGAMAAAAPETAAMAAAVASAARPMMNRDGARPVSRRMVTVTTQEEFEAAVASDTTIEVAADIYLSSEIDIDGITGLVINGNGFKIDGQGYVTSCMWIEGGSEVTMNQLTVTNGYVVSDPRGNGIFWQCLIP